MGWSLPQRRALASAAGGGAGPPGPSGPQPILYLNSNDSIGGATATSITCRVSGLVFVLEGAGVGPVIDIVAIPGRKLLRTVGGTSRLLRNNAAGAVAGMLDGISPQTAIFYTYNGAPIMGSVADVELALTNRIDWQLISGTSTMRVAKRAGGAADTNYDYSSAGIIPANTRTFWAFSFDGVSTKYYKNGVLLTTLATGLNIGGQSVITWMGRPTVGPATSSASHMAWQLFGTALTAAEIVDQQALITPEFT